MNTQKLKIPAKPEHPHTTRLVVMVVYPDAHILDVVGPLEVLTGTRLFLSGEKEPYETCLVAH
ncbi:MAG: hypothetical protein AB8B64_04850 [Granulosicoccus sp.]